MLKTEQETGTIRMYIFKGEDYYYVVRGDIDLREYAKYNITDAI